MRSEEYQQVVITKHHFRLAGHILTDTMPSKTFDWSPGRASSKCVGRWPIRISSSCP